MRFRNINIRNIMNEAVNNQGIIVDVREWEEFANGHIPMAVNLPLSDIENGKVGLPKNKVIIVYCEHGSSSMMAARILADKGYNVLNAVGGIRSYRGALTKRR